MDANIPTQPIQAPPQQILSPTPNFEFQQVVDFYNNAWGMFMTAGGILLGVLAIVGVIWPILMYVYQNHSFKMREKAIEDKFNKYLKTLEEKLEEAETRYTEKADTLNKRTWHTLGDSQYGLAQLWNKAEAYDVSFIMTINAISSYLNAGDERLTDHALNYLLRSKIISMNPGDICPKALKDIITTLQLFVPTLIKHNDTEKYSEAIDTFKNILNIWGEESKG
ncbi:MAG: hypothetical protein GXY86_17805 [Firmicutes bacterium]|nr:hypothetical protein [Bacillota bacterium]